MAPTLTNSAQLILPPRVPDLDLVLDKDVAEQPPSTPLITPNPSFNLHQQSQSHHPMTLQSQNQTPSQTPHIIEPDDNQAFFPAYQSPHPHHPHVIPPDQPNFHPTNFKQLAVNQIVANHLFNSHQVHHVFNEIT